MGNYENLKQSITEVIRTNGNQEITGAVLQSTLLTIISTVGANATFAGIATPTTNPGTPDGSVFYLASESGTYTNFNAIELQDGLSVLIWNGSWSSQQIFGIDNEPIAGSDNLVKSGGVYAKIKALEDAGYVFAGIATPTTNPGTPDGSVFYLASESGTYTNFNAIELQDGLSVLMWNGSWSGQQIFSIDDVPTAGSDNLVKSGGIQEELALGTVYDVSAKNPTAGTNNDGKFESLSALLEDANLDTLIPTSIRKGGMSIKFVQSSDNKYVQWRLMANSFTTDTTQWCGVKKEPFAYSKNIVESGGIFDADARIKFDINEQFPYEGYYDKDNNGAFVSNASYRVSVLIPFTSGNITVNHTSKNPHANSLSFFDSSKNFIGGIDIPSAQADTEKTYTYISISSQFPSTAFMAVCTSPNSEAYIKINSIGTLRMEDEKINEKILQVQDSINIDEQIIFGYPFKDNYFWNKSGVRTYNSGFICTDKIKLEGIIYIYAVGTNSVGSSVSNVVFFKEDGSVSSITPTMTWGSSEKKVLWKNSFPSDASYAAFNAVANNKDIAFVRVDKGSVQQMILNTGFNVWADKNGVCYGDSITAMNPSYVDNLITNSVFKQTLRRAVGGQTFKWNSYCYYCEREGDGAYLDRYIYDAQGQNTGVVVTKNISAEDIANIENHYGVQIDIHYGCFCSWDRITAMIPESIRESINAIILMGGTNDWNSNEDISANIPEWSATNTTDNEWINSSLYNGGDYDVTTFAGAFMSTIMKFQKWCPNAIIIICTPYGNWDNTTKKQTLNTINKTVQDYANKEKELATYLAHPIIDVNSLTTVNAFNKGEYFVDNIHPSTKGSALIANVIIEKLNGIYPNPN